VRQILQSKPGAVGVVDVYSIASAVKVLRVDGKLPFDSGYVFRGNRFGAAQPETAQVGLSEYEALQHSGKHSAEPLQWIPWGKRNAARPPS